MILLSKLPLVYRFLAFTAGFVGPFDAYYTTADVRVRAWLICDFPPANYSSNIYGVGGPRKSKPDTS